MNNLIEKVRSYPTITHYDADLGVALTDAIARPGLSVCRGPRVLSILSDRTVFSVAGSWG